MTTRRRDTAPPTPLQQAEQAVADFEALELGGDITEPRALAERSVTNLSDQAREEFSRLQPHSGDVLSQLEFELGAFTRARLAHQLPELAAAALVHHPALARALRSGPVLARLRDAATWSIGDVPAQPVVEEALERLAAVYLEADPQDEPARVLAVAVPSLRARIATVVARHEAHAVQVAAEHVAAAEARQARIARGRDVALDELRAWFHARPGIHFVYGGGNVFGQDQTLTGPEYSSRALASDNPKDGVAEWRVQRAVQARQGVEPAYRWPSDDELEQLGDDPTPAGGFFARVGRALGAA